MNEVSVLTLCFVFTFGLLGYKLRSIVVRFLDNYSRKIEDEVNYSEQLKKKAIFALDEAQKKENEIKSTIMDMQSEYMKKMSAFEKQINERMNRDAEKLLALHKNRIQNDADEFFEDMKKKIVNSVIFCVNEYVNTRLSCEQRDEMRLKMFTKVNFKKLFGQ